MKKTIAVGLLVSFLLLLYPGGDCKDAYAQYETGYDLVAAVNALRAAYGLEPYTIDYGIMDYAQQHSQYQADTQTSTHTHSDGTNSLSQGLIENVAGGDTGYVTVDIVVNQIWVDWGHLNTMIGYESGQVGGGVADGANNTTYYTLNVRVGQKVTTTLTPGTPLAATAPFLPIITATPLPSGEIWHLVLEGETLWGIAVSYGVTMQQIRDMNGMLAEDSVIYPGDLLLIRTSVGVSEVVESPTSPPITLTPENTATSTYCSTLEPTVTSSPTAVITEVVSTNTVVNRNLLLVLGIILGSAGVVLGGIAILIIRKEGHKKRG